MPAKPKALCVQHRRPPVPHPDPAGIRIKPLRLLQPRQPRELGMQRMLLRQKRLLAMQNRRVPILRIPPNPQPERPQVYRQRLVQRRMRARLEVRIAEIRNLGLGPMQLDDVRPLHPPEIPPGTPLEQPKRHRQRLQRQLVDIKCAGRQPPRMAARQPLDVPLQRHREIDELRPSVKPGQHQIDEQILPPRLGIAAHRSRSVTRSTTANARRTLPNTSTSRPLSVSITASFKAGSIILPCVQHS